MTPNTTTYVGMDITKATLQVHSNGHQIEFENNAPGHTQLSKHLAKLSHPQVICEATEGYEYQVLDASHQGKVLVSILNSAQNLAATKDQGKRALRPPSACLHSEMGPLAESMRGAAANPPSPALKVRNRKN